jgi:hypothetical protein
MPAAIAQGLAHRRAVVSPLAEKQLVISLNSMAQNAGFVNLFLHARTSLAIAALGIYNRKFRGIIRVAGQPPKGLRAWTGLVATPASRRSHVPLHV